MKRIFCLLLVLCLFPVLSLADLPDISGLNFDELVLLRSQLNLAIWKCQEWQEVTVPIGVWKIGEDIPAGKWHIRGANGYTYLKYSDTLDASGMDATYSGDVYYSAIISETDDTEPDSIDLDCADGMYIVIDSGSAVFSPFTGKPSLGFQ